MTAIQFNEVYHEGVINTKYIINRKGKLLSVSEAAILYHIYKKKLYNLIRNESIRSERMGDRYMIYDYDIDYYLAKEAAYIRQRRN